MFPISAWYTQFIYLKSSATDVVMLSFLVSFGVMAFIDNFYVFTGSGSLNAGEYAGSNNIPNAVPPPHGNNVPNGR